MRIDLRLVAALLGAASLVALGACGDEEAAGTGGGDPGASTHPPPDGPPDDPPPGEPPVALLELHSLDLWAQELPGAIARLTVTRDGTPLEATAVPLATVELREAGTYSIRLEADGHLPLEAEAVFDGTDGLHGVVAGLLPGEAPAGLTVSHDLRTIGEATTPVHTLHLGLRHRWFSAQGRPARRGNTVRLMTSGEEAWEKVASELATATDHVHAATWWWESNFELVRDVATHPTSTPAERTASTILARLDAIPATKRVLVNQLYSQDGTISGMTSDDAIRARGAAAGDGFEFMGQANETRGTFQFVVKPFLFADRVRAAFPAVATTAIDDEPELPSTVPSRQVDLTDWPFTVDLPGASFHQKFLAIDGDRAFVGGMNLRRVDWDTDAHLIFEPRRMLLDSTAEERAAVVAHDALPDTGPRKDFMTHLAGPIVQDVEDVFHERWAHQLESQAEHWERASDFEIPRGQAEVPGGVQAQLTATLPAPFSEHAIAESWWNAIASAEQYIYIEDQYFRVPMLTELIRARMNEIPGLELVVITKPVNTLTDPGCEDTFQMALTLRTQFPTRFHLFQLRSFDVQVTWGVDETEERFTDMDVHSKMFVVDDVFLSVGSANKNNRGIVYEGELNVAVHDKDWVSAERRRLLSLILPAGTVVADDAFGWISQLESAAAANATVTAAWDDENGDISLDGDPLPASYTPSGFVYPLHFDVPGECLLESIGPDMT